MSIARDRAVMLAVGSLALDDLVRHGVMAGLMARGARVEVEDVDFVEDSVVQEGVRFTCEASITFSTVIPEGRMSDSAPCNVYGVLQGDKPTITGLMLAPTTDQIAA